MALHVALSMRLDAIEAHRLAKEYRAEVLAEAAAPALDALRLIYTDMVTCRSGGDEWASEWLGETWTALPLEVRASAGDTEAAEELANAWQFAAGEDAERTVRDLRTGADAARRQIADRDNGGAL